ncbi:MAG: hypothetical protein LCH96_10785 [Actinobacteria bacterium]|nr:hypothetical protein [Actinomycetota bacterium]
MSETEQRGTAAAVGADILPLGLAGRILLRNWVLLIAGLALGVAGGWALARAVPPTYSATATQFVKGIPGTGVAANYEAAQFAVSRARSYPSFIYSQEVLEGVARDMGVSDMSSLRESLTATNPSDTPLVQITATGATATEARDKANSAARHMATFITDIETVDGKTPITVETAVQALLPTEPSDPRLSVYVAIGGTIGLALAVILALVRFFAGQRVTGNWRPSRQFRRFRKTRPVRAPAHAVPSAPLSPDEAAEAVADAERSAHVLEAASDDRGTKPQASRPPAKAGHKRGARRRKQMASRRVHSRV